MRAAATLFRRSGYAATGINEIAELSGAPKGSLYHYFPDGKQQIGEAAVRFAGRGVVVTLEKLEQEHKTTAIGKLYLRTGNCQKAQEHFDLAVTMYREMDMTYWLEQVQAELRQLG